MFDLNRLYNRCYNWPIVAPIDIKHVHSSMIYDRRGCESPSGYGAL